MELGIGTASPGSAPHASDVKPRRAPAPGRSGSHAGLAPRVDHGAAPRASSSCCSARRRRSTCAASSRATRFSLRVVFAHDRRRASRWRCSTRGAAHGQAGCTRSRGRRSSSTSSRGRRSSTSPGARRAAPLRSTRSPASSARSSSACAEPGSRRRWASASTGSLCAALPLRLDPARRRTRAAASYAVTIHELTYPLLVNTLGVSVVALLAGYLAERLRLTGGALQAANVARARGRAARGARAHRRGAGARDPQPARLDHGLDRDAARVAGAVGRRPAALRHRAARGAKAQRSGRRHGRPLQAPPAAGRGHGRGVARARGRRARRRTPRAGTDIDGDLRRARGAGARPLRRRRRCGRCSGTWSATRCRPARPAPPSPSASRWATPRSCSRSTTRGQACRKTSARASSRTSSRRARTAPASAWPSCGASSKTTPRWGVASRWSDRFTAGRCFRVTLSRDTSGLRRSARPPSA